jgi:hypothetical protein
MRRLAVFMAVALGLATLSASSAQSAVMTIEFTEPPGPPTTHRVVVFVGAVACTEAEFDATSPPSAILGVAGQPPACSVEGAEVSFLQFRDGYEIEESPIVPVELSDRTVFAAGTTFEFRNWAPPPASDPGPLDPLPSYMRAFVGAEAGLPPPTPGVDVIPPMTIDLVDPESAAPIERLVLFVGPQPCLSISFEPAPPTRVHLGTPDQPFGCGNPGDSITALQIRSATQALELGVRTVLAPGGTYRWANWAPQPPGTPLPDYMQAFLDAGAVIQPSASGNAGLAPSRAASKAEVLILLVGAALLVGTTRRITRERSH